MSERSPSIVGAALAACVLASTAQAQEAVKENPTQRPQQVIPTGTEDAPAAAGPAARAAVPAAQQSEAALFEQLEEMTSESSEGLEPVRHPDGTVTVDLQGRFQSVLVATPREDGGYDVTCHTGHDAVHAAHHAHRAETGHAPKNPAPKAPVLEEE